MRKHLVSLLLLLFVLTCITTACGSPATPTPTRKPTQPPTSVPPPTVSAPPTLPQPTLAPVVLPTVPPPPPPTLVAVATVPLPSPTPPPPPTKAAPPATPKPAVAASPTALKLPAPKGSIAYHVNDNGVDRVRILNLEGNTTTPLLDVGPVMDLAMNTSARMGEWSPDNTKWVDVYTTSANGINVLEVLDLKNDEMIELYSSDNGGGLSSPVWSPDGKRIAFIRMSSKQQLWAITVVNADGSGSASDLRTNGNGESFRGGLSWSKNGVLAFAQNTTGASDIYTILTDGGGLANLTNNPADDNAPAWSPDGKLLAFTSNREGHMQIYVMNANGSGLRRVSQSSTNDWGASWSPDGNWMAFTSTRDGSMDVYLMDTRGGNVKRLTTGGGDRPMWSH